VDILDSAFLFSRDPTALGAPARFGIELGRSVLGCSHFVAGDFPQGFDGLSLSLGFLFEPAFQVVDLVVRGPQLAVLLIDPPVEDAYLLFGLVQACALLLMGIAQRYQLTAVPARGMAQQEITGDKSDNQSHNAGDDYPDNVFGRHITSMGGLFVIRTAKEASSMPRGEKVENSSEVGNLAVTEEVAKQKTGEKFP